MRVVIIGGGPSGAFCAMGLLHGAGHSHVPPEVVILDRRIFSACGPRGCNLCAGVIADSLVRNLHSLGLTIPPQVVQREIQGYHFINPAGSAHLQKDAGATILTAYRALGPPDTAYSEERSFDRFLLQHAVSLGAVHLRELVTDIIPPDGRNRWRVEFGNGRRIDADIVVGACGVHTPFLRKFTQLGFGYRPPRTIHACQAEVPLAKEAVTDCFRDEVKIIALGVPGIKFAAMTPKEQHVTVTLIGKHVKRQHLDEFLQLPQVRSLFPRNWRPPDVYCHCHPKIPITSAAQPVADRLVIVGDAHVSRYLKNGLNSAFHTGLLAARAITETGGNVRGLRRRYDAPCRRLFMADNAVGRALFKLHDLTEHSPSVAAAIIRAYQEENHLMPEHALRRHTRGPAVPARFRGECRQALWNMFTGDLPYWETMKCLLSPPLALRAARVLLLPHQPPTNGRHSLRIQKSAASGSAGIADEGTPTDGSAA